MTIQYCDEVGDIRYRKAKYNRLVTEFINSGREYGFVEFDDTRDVRKASAGIRTAIKRNGLTMKAMMRGNRIYLIREDIA